MFYQHPDRRAAARGRHSPFRTTDFLIDEGIAYAQIRAALRAFRIDSLRNAVFLLRLPEHDNADFWGRAISHFFGDYCRARGFGLHAAGWPAGYEPDKASAFGNPYSLDADEIRKKLALPERDFVCVLVPHDYEATDFDRLLIDFDAHIEVPTPRMAAAALKTYGISKPGDALIKAFLDADTGRRWIAMRKSASASGLLERLHAIASFHSLLEHTDDDGEGFADRLLDELINEQPRPAKKTPPSKGKYDPPAVEPVDIATLEGAPDLEHFAGAGDAVEWAMDLKRDLIDYKAGRISWADVDRGALLHGPPGCGKTSFARAIAKSLGVPLFQSSGAEWMAPDHAKDPGFGDCGKAMKATFRAAIEAAPAVLFVDEVDVFSRREDLGSGRSGQWMRDFTNLFLEQLDGFNGREGIVVVGATNFPAHVDPAVRRPGRLDREIELGLPNAKAREGILKWHLGVAGRHLDLGPAAAAAEGMTGADLEKVAREARRVARRQGRELVEADIAALLPGYQPPRSGVVVELAAFKR